MSWHPGEGFSFSELARRRAILCQNVSSGVWLFFSSRPRGAGRIGTKFLASYFLVSISIVGSGYLIGLRDRF